LTPVAIGVRRTSSWRDKGIRSLLCANPASKFIMPAFGVAARSTGHLMLIISPNWSQGDKPITEYALELFDLCALGSFLIVINREALENAPIERMPLSLSTSTSKSKSTCHMSANLTPMPPKSYQYTKSRQFFPIRDFRLSQISIPISIHR
jgi:hypothetical protein